jgi:apolipoprotein N-acyltransferase
MNWRVPSWKMTRVPLIIVPSRVEVDTGGGFMSAAASFLSLGAGAVLLAVVSRTAVPPAAWIAFILLLHGTRAVAPMAGLPLLLIAVYVALAVGNRGIFPIPDPGYFAITAAISLIFTVPFAIDRSASQRSSGVLFTLIFPIAVVAAEFLKSRFTSAATWGSVAYTQYGNLAIMQIAAIVGIWGITFAITWFASTVEFAWSRGFDWNSVRVPVLVCVGTLIVVVLAGALRVALARDAATSLRAATLNRPVDLFVPGEMTRITEGRVQPSELPHVREKLAELHNWFLDGSRREARAGALLIAWPEANLLVFREDESGFLERARRVAREEHVYLSMGIASIQQGASLPFENKTVLIEPSGTIVMDYLKSRPVAGWETSIMRPGDGHLRVASTAAGRLAAAICFEADFPEFIRQAGQERADLLIVPANEWKAIKKLHMQMAVFRAIENGVPILRPAASGLSSAIDPWGRVLAVADYFASGDRTMTAQLPIGHVWTAYPHIGDLFAWCCVAALPVLMIIATVRAPR